MREGDYPSLCANKRNIIWALRSKWVSELGIRIVMMAATCRIRATWSFASLSFVHLIFISPDSATLSAGPVSWLLSQALYSWNKTACVSSGLSCKVEPLHSMARVVAVRLAQRHCMSRPIEVGVPDVAQALREMGVFARLSGGVRMVFLLILGGVMKGSMVNGWGGGWMAGGPVLALVVRALGVLGVSGTRARGGGDCPFVCMGAGVGHAKISAAGRREGQKADWDWTGWRTGAQERRRGRLKEVDEGVLSMANNG